MTDVAFRPAVAEDLDRLLSLIHSAYRGDSARLGWTHEADLLDGQRTDVVALEAILADPADTIIVGERGGILIGCVRVTALGGGLSSLGMLAVDPVRQAGGLGRRLIAEAEEHAATHKSASRMEMTVIAQRSELIEWYQRRGYQRTGETRAFPATDPRFGIPRRSDLAFVVLEKALQ